jgi:hypothetical protein
MEQPYLHEMQDGRRALSKKQKEEIRKLYKEKNHLSQRQLAKKFGVSRRLIVFTIYPERLKKLQEYQKNIKHWNKYYNTDKRREYMRTYRAKKRKLGFIK